jgi:hypothetical protein
VSLVFIFMVSVAICHGQRPTDDTTASQPAAPDADAQPQQSGATTDTKSGTDRANPTPTDHVDRVDDRVFGVLPNYGTVKNAPDVPPLTKRQTLNFASLDSFDPYVYPFVAVVAGLAQLQHQDPSFGAGTSGYLKRYATSFADNTVGNFMVEAVLPMALGQDSRYFQSGIGSVWHRLGYAVSRIVVGRDLQGHPRFNVAEIGGNGIAAGLSNLYHPGADRSVNATLTLWATQVMWDTLANVSKEFWPDIHARLHRQRPQP